MLMPRFLLVSAFCFNIYLGTVSPAWAYLDPGTGSMMLQLMLASIAGGLVVIKMYWHKIKKFFSRDKRDAQENKDDNRS
jgi:hypothetical protein